MADKEEKEKKEEKKEKKERKEKKRKEGEDGEKKERKERKKKDGEGGEKKKKKKKRDGEDGERKKKKRGDGEDGERKKKKDGEEGGEKKKKRERRHRDIFEVYDIGEELGRGAFSVVKMAVCKKDGSKWAVKIIDKKSAGQDMDRLETEIEILKKVTHPNIICLKDIYDTKSMFYIVTELVTGGELFDKIVEVGNYTEKDAAILVEKMLSAIGYLHSMGIVHRDLKPENLLLKDGSNITEITLADFGLSKIVGQKVMMQTACGTPGYVAPEVLQAQGYGPEVDLWSIGVITYILLCGFPPFYHENLPDLFEQIISADFDFPEEYWDSVSNEGKDFIKKLLVVKPAERMAVDQAMEHPWIQSQGGGAGNSQIKSTFAEEMKKYTATRRQQSKVNAAS